MASPLTLVSGISATKGGNGITTARTYSDSEISSIYPNPSLHFTTVAAKAEDRALPGSEGTGWAFDRADAVSSSRRSFGGVSRQGTAKTARGSNTSSMDSSIGIADSWELQVGGGDWNPVGSLFYLNSP